MCLLRFDFKRSATTEMRLHRKPPFMEEKRTHPISFPSDFTISGRAAGCGIAPLLAQHRYVESVRIELDGKRKARGVPQ